MKQVSYVQGRPSLLCPRRKTRAGTGPFKECGLVVSGGPYGVAGTICAILGLNRCFGVRSPRFGMSLRGLNVRDDPRSVVVGGGRDCPPGSLENGASRYGRWWRVHVEMHAVGFQLVEFAPGAKQPLRLIRFVRHGFRLSRFEIVSMFCVSGGGCRRGVQLIGFVRWGPWTAPSESSIGVHFDLTDARCLAYRLIVSSF